MGIGGQKSLENKPWYVAKKDIDSNVITVVQGNDHPLLFSKRLSTKNLFLINPLKTDDYEGSAKVRYRQEDQECKFQILENKIEVEFKNKQRSITPGQSVVLYKDQVCLGGGEISSIS